MHLNIAYNIGMFFKYSEWIFWLAELWIIVHLIDPRKAFENNLKIINCLLRFQGFDTQLSFVEKAFKIWRRDLWILVFLNPLIIVLIHLI